MVLCLSHGGMRWEEVLTWSHVNRGLDSQRLHRICPEFPLTLTAPLGALFQSQSFSSSELLTSAFSGLLTSTTVIASLVEGHVVSACKVLPLFHDHLMDFWLNPCRNWPWYLRAKLRFLELSWHGGKESEAVDCIRFYPIACTWWEGFNGSFSFFGLYATLFTSHRGLLVIGSRQFSTPWPEMLFPILTLRFQFGTLFLMCQICFSLPLKILFGDYK